MNFMSILSHTTALFGTATYRVTSFNCILSKKKKEGEGPIVSEKKRQLQYMRKTRIYQTLKSKKNPSFLLFGFLPSSSETFSAVSLDFSPGSFQYDIVSSIGLSQSGLIPQTMLLWKLHLLVFNEKKEMSACIWFGFKSQRSFVRFVLIRSKFSTVFFFGASQALNLTSTEFISLKVLASFLLRPAVVTTEGWKIINKWQKNRSKFNSFPNSCRVFKTVENHKF